MITHTRYDTPILWRWDQKFREGIEESMKSNFLVNPPNLFFVLFTFNVIIIESIQVLFKLLFESWNKSNLKSLHLTATYGNNQRHLLRLQATGNHAITHKVNTCRIAKTLQYKIFITCEFRRKQKFCNMNIWHKMPKWCHI